jgi:hypothetical protein
VGPEGGPTFSLLMIGQQLSGLHVNLKLVPVIFDGFSAHEAPRVR